MTLVEIIQNGNEFLLEATKQTLSREEVQEISEPFHAPYPEETFNLRITALRKAARKRGFYAKDYNAYTGQLDDSVSPIQGRVQLYFIPQEKALQESKRWEEIALDALWEAAGY